MAAQSGGHRRLVAVGDTLLPASFQKVGAPGVVAWHQGTTATVVFAPHPSGCSACTGYLAELGTAVAGLRDWATRVMVLVADPDGGGDPALTAAAGAGVLLLADADSSGRRHLGAGDDQAVVVQTDRYGAVFEAEAVASPDADHEPLPLPAALISLAEYIDVQCPECGVPSREWLAATRFPLG
ncbi:MAG: hypothetical protein ACRDZ8_14050 [Acidimicrobiales bacterium]